jgi:hypothetical protein
LPQNYRYLGLVEKDLSYLRTNSKENIHKYIDEYLSAEYENCLAGLNDIMKEAWQMSLEGEKRKDVSLSIGKGLLSNETRIAIIAYRSWEGCKFCQQTQGGLTVQDKEVVIDDSEEPIENTGQVRRTIRL